VRSGTLPLCSWDLPLWEDRTVAPSPSRAIHPHPRACLTPTARPPMRRTSERNRPVLRNQTDATSRPTRGRVPAPSLCATSNVIQTFARCWFSTGPAAERGPGRAPADAWSCPFRHMQSLARDLGAARGWRPRLAAVAVTGLEDWADVAKTAGPTSRTCRRTLSRSSTSLIAQSTVFASVGLRGIVRLTSPILSAGSEGPWPSTWQPRGRKVVIGWLRRRRWPGCARRRNTSLPTGRKRK
jgi:hypothetical protein